MTTFFANTLYPAAYTAATNVLIDQAEYCAKKNEFLTDLLACTVEKASEETSRFFSNLDLSKIDELLMPPLSQAIKKVAAASCIGASSTIINAIMTRLPGVKNINPYLRVATSLAAGTAATFFAFQQVEELTFEPNHLAEMMVQVAGTALVTKAAVPTAILALKTFEVFMRWTGSATRLLVSCPLEAAKWDIGLPGREVAPAPKGNTGAPAQKKDQ